MSFLRTLLILVFVFLLVGANGSYAGKISNCSNCDKDKLSKLLWSLIKSSYRDLNFHTQNLK